MLQDDEDESAQLMLSPPLPHLLCPSCKHYIYAVMEDGLPKTTSSGKRSERMREMNTKLLGRYRKRNPRTVIWSMVAVVAICCGAVLVACLAVLLPKRRSCSNPADNSNGTGISHQTEDASVGLGYASYQGTSLAVGVNQYLGMRFAASPTGHLRWRAPADPEQETVTIDATVFKPVCLASGTVLPDDSQAEDCLFINVWTPRNTTPESKLPVWFNIQGGGYCGNANGLMNMSNVIDKSGHNVVVVTSNYRVGAFGFLASESVRADGDLNVGLLDQRKAMQWVQKYISLFGGDASKVVIHGASAGAGSVALHLTAYGGRNDDLFIGAIVESPFFPTQPRVSDLEWQFEQYTTQLGCYTDKMTCLRSSSVEQLQSANVHSTYPDAYDAAIFSWTPTVDGDLIEDYPYKMFESGKFIDVPLLLGDDTNEGSLFAADAAKPIDVEVFFANQYPKLSTSDAQLINDQYPLMAPLPQHQIYFPSASAAYGEACFICPGLHILQSLTRKKGSQSPRKTWSYRYDVQDETSLALGLGVSHTCELAAIFGPDHTGIPWDTTGVMSSYKTYNAAIIPVVMNYFISFVRSLDPNLHRQLGSPEWYCFSSRDGSGVGNGTGKDVSFERLVFVTNRTAMEVVSEELLGRCEFWKGLAGVMEV